MNRKQGRMAGGPRDRTAGPPSQAPTADRLLGEALARHRAGALDEAEAVYREALTHNPRQPDVLHLLGVLRYQRGDAEEAVDLIGKALAVQPRFAEAHNHLGVALRIQGQVEEAVKAHRRSVEIKPDCAEAYNNLGVALRTLGRLDEAAAVYHRALSLRPDYAEAYNNLGVTLRTMGRPDEAVAAYRQALGIGAGYAEAHSNLLLAMHYSPAYDAETLYAEAKAWNRVHGVVPGVVPPHDNVADPDRRLRIGYVSPDFREHSVSYFFEPLLAAHDRNVVEVFCYAEVARPDATSDRLRALADRWLAIPGMSGDAVAERIRADGVDILVDLAGHTANNRLAVFARKPAPVQVSSYLGYPGTTGLAAMDYRLTDPVADPPGRADALHSETLVRLPRGFHCYRPPDEAPRVAPLPAAAAGYVTFGSFNNLAKVTPEVVAVWAEILRRRPGARLLLKSAGLAEPEARRRYATQFAGQGVEGTRLEMMGPLATKGAHMALYSRVDIGLDPFPYNGMTTTCEALWMGVPVIALNGERHVARVGTSLLDTVGLPDLAADSVEGYIERAVALAGDIDNLTTLRAGLRERVSASALGDADGFARHVEAAYRGMWRKWCAGTAANG